MIFIIGFYIICKVKSFNHGSVSLIYSSRRFKMPENIAEVPRLLPPVLTLIYSCAQISKNSMDHLKDLSSSVMLDPFANNNMYFPPTFVSTDNNFNTSQDLLENKYRFIEACKRLNCTTA